LFTNKNNSANEKAVLFVVDKKTNQTKTKTKTKKNKNNGNVQFTIKDQSQGSRQKHEHAARVPCIINKTDYQALWGF
jgi:hypothetical protein